MQCPEKKPVEYSALQQSPHRKMGPSCIQSYPRGDSQLQELDGMGVAGSYQGSSQNGVKQPLYVKEAGGSPFPGNKLYFALENSLSNIFLLVHKVNVCQCGKERQL